MSNRRSSSPSIGVLLARTEATLDALGALLAILSDAGQAQAAETLVRRLRTELKRLGTSVEAEILRLSGASESVSARSQKQQGAITTLRQQLQQARTRADKAEMASAQLQEQLSEMRAAEIRGRRVIQELHRYIRRLENRITEGRPASPPSPGTPTLSRSAAFTARLIDQAGGRAGGGFLVQSDGDAPGERPHWHPVVTPAWNDIRPPSMTPSLGRLNYAASTANLPIVAVLLFGLDRSATDIMVTLVSEELMRSPAFVPVFITDCSDFRAFRADHYAFEYFPRDAAARPDADDLDWPAYYERRAMLIRDKWRPSVALVLGAQPPFDPDLLRVPQPAPH